MKKVRDGLAGAAALTALLLLGACDQNSGEQASGETDGSAVIEMPPEDVAAADDPDDAATACQAAADALGGVWVGRAFAEAESAIMAGEGVATIRVIRPGTMVTKDFRIDRLNVDVDESGNVTRIYCG